MHPKVAEAIQQIDAALFNGDTFEDPSERAELIDYLKRWCKRVSQPYYGTTAPKFDEEWAKYVARGYNYGQDALENVKFGFAIAAEAYTRGYIEYEGDDDDEEGNEEEGPEEGDQEGKEEGGGQEDG